MSETGADAVPIKKQKLDNGDSKDTDSPPVLKNFGGVAVEKIISDYAKGKTLTVHGKIEGKDAVVLMEKTHFEAKTINKILSENTVLKNTLKNDVYGTYEAYPPPSENVIKVTVVHPATDRHIKKYTYQDVHVVHETAKIYKTVTLPLLENAKFSMQWVYNILEKKQEADRIIFEDADPEIGFVLLPDMKWDRKDPESLYLVAIAHKHNIKSVRDLNKDSLPLLKNIQKKGMQAIFEKYGIPTNKQQLFIHYQPSYYHFHVHFSHVKLEPPGFGADRSHMLAEVIHNIETYNDYYEHATLTYNVREQDDLYEKLKEAGVFNHDESNGES